MKAQKTGFSDVQNRLLSARSTAYMVREQANIQSYSVRLEYGNKPRAEQE